MTLPTVAASPEALQQLPTPARPRLDPAAVLLPAGYRAEQIGLALGRPQAVDVAVRVVAEEGRHQLLLREVLLEFAADAVLYRRDV